MLFADADMFWKPPNAYDTAGIVGLVIGVASIWLSWWLAKHDIAKRVDEAAERAAKAAREEVRRVADALLRTGISDVVRALDSAREACGGRRWGRAAELCLLAGQLLARVLGQPRLTDALRAELEAVSRTLTTCAARLRRLPHDVERLPPVVDTGLHASLLTLHRIEGTMTGIRLEADRE